MKGLIGKVQKTEENDNSTVAQAVEVHYKEIKSCVQFGGLGESSVPVKGDKVIVIPVEGTGNCVVLGTLTVTNGAKEGEKILYSRDENGKTVATIWLHNDGSMAIKADKNVTVDGEKIVIQGGGKKAARVDDDVEVEIPAGSVIVSVSGGSGAPAVGVANATPIKCTGKIKSGSEKVEIG